MEEWWNILNDLFVGNEVTIMNTHLFTHGYKWGGLNIIVASYLKGFVKAKT